MAERRMFTKKISDSDAFIEMSAAAQALYFHLNQGADDDGFNNQVQMAMWKSHASIDDLKVLMAKNFIIRFESGVIVIKHWRMHNTLRKDRYTPTNFQEELAMLGVKENEAYTLNGCQTVAKRLPQYSIGKDSIGEDSIGKKKQHENSVLTSEFEEAWKLYPNKQGKEKSRNCYIKARKEGITREEIEIGVKRYAEYCKVKGIEKKYIKHGDTWFGNKSWQDDYDITKGENNEVICGDNRHSDIEGLIVY